MSLATQIIDQRVAGILKEQAEPFTQELRLGRDEDKRRSAAFVFLTSKTVLNLSDEDILDGLVDGGNDFGIDAVYYSPPSDGEISITIFQGKYKRKLEGDAKFPENGIALMISAIGVIFDPALTLNLNDRLQKRIEEVRSFVAGGAIPRVSAIMCNNGLSWSAEAQRRIDNSHNNFGDQVEWRHVGPEDLLLLLQARKPIEVTLQLTGSAIVEPFDFRRVLIGRMSVSELARLADQFGDRLLDRNIRRYLGLSGNRVNEAIASTLRDPGQRANFYFYNNGITFICSQFRHNALQQGSWQVQVSGLQIVNGGQTSRTVQQTARDAGPGIADAQVLVRIYELPSNDEDLVNSITYATNSQNPVDLRDLKANDPRQKALAESIRNLGFDYRTKREEGPVSSRELTSAVIAEAVLAIWRRRPNQARFLAREHFGALYDIIFSEKLNGAQAVTAALLMRLAENRRKRPPDRAPDFLVYGSRFIAMQMGRYLLDDLQLDLDRLDRLDHRMFPQAEQLIDNKGESYFAKAVEAVSIALDPLFHDRERTLQRLSAAFRRADLVETLTGKPLKAEIGSSVA